jgi:hypothetical protein
VGALKPPAQDDAAPPGATWGAAAAAARSAAGDGFDRPSARAGALPPSLARGIAELDAPDGEDEGADGAHIPDADAIRCGSDGRFRFLGHVRF